MKINKIIKDKIAGSRNCSELNYFNLRQPCVFDLVLCVTQICNGLSQKTTKLSYIGQSEAKTVPGPTSEQIRLQERRHMSYEEEILWQMLTKHPEVSLGGS